MTAKPLLSLHVDQPGRQGRDRLEILTALINAPSFDPLFRADIIKIPPGHPVYRWDCLVTGCERPKAGRGDLCSAHARQWRDRRRGGETAKADFVRAASPAGPAGWIDERPCRICPGRPARSLALVLCDKHQFRWYRHLELQGAGAEFDAWLGGQHPACRLRRLLGAGLSGAGELTARVVRSAREPVPVAGKPWWSEVALAVGQSI